MNFQKFIDEITAPLPSNECLSWVMYKQENPTTREKIKQLLQEIDKAKDRGYLNMALYYVYLLRKAIEEESSLRERKSCKQMLTMHYRSITKRVCCLFGDDRTPLILTCKVITFTSIRHMSATNFKKLLEAAEKATAIRLLGEENDLLQED